MFYIYLLSQEAAMIYFLYQYVKKTKRQVLIHHIYFCWIFDVIFLFRFYHTHSNPGNCDFFSKSQKRLQNLVMSMLISFMIVMPWLVRNYILLGNPIWPFGGGKCIDPIIYKNTYFSWISITGGEPFIRNDITDIVEIVSKYTDAKIVSINTNGIANDKILNDIRQILKKIDKKCYFL